MAFIPRKPDRTPWDNFRTVYILAEISRVHGHPDYAAAKKGDLHAALKLTATVLDTDTMTQLAARYTAPRPIIVGVQAVEGAGVNIIPQTTAIFLADALGLSLDTAIVQINRVGHTKASGWHRLLHQALFDGPVQTGADYLLVDDFIGQGGTLTNLKGLIERQGGKVIGAIALTGKPYSATLALTQETLLTLRQKHGILESWNPGGENNLVSALQTLPSLKHDISFAPRMLTPSEIVWLRQHKEAVTAELRQLMKETGLLDHNRWVA